MESTILINHSADTDKQQQQSYRIRYYLQKTQLLSKHNHRPNQRSTSSAVNYEAHGDNFYFKAVVCGEPGEGKNNLN
jgi:hypothetical protein